MAASGMTRTAGPRWASPLRAARCITSQFLSCLVLSALVFSWLLIFSNSVTAGEENGFAQFAAHDEASRIVIDYGPWNTVLRSLVSAMGTSNRFNPNLTERRTGTRINLGNQQPSWLEGNRVQYELLKDGHTAAISEYRRELETLPAQFGGLQNLSRREQLAYWLNLYNVTILEQVAYRYPIVTLRRFLIGTRKKVGLLDQKLLRVMDVELSLNDIQNRILIPVFKDPLVLYGLHQGVVGSPNIRRTAYRGDNVWEALRLNAVDFVNSIRGVNLRKKVARASEFYARGAAAFPQGSAGLRRHLMAFADDRTREILDAAETIETTYFDWHIADLYNGRQKHVSIYANAVYDFSGNATSLDFMTPDHVQRYFTGLRMKFREFGYPNTRVTIEDVPRNEAADAPASKDDGGPAKDQEEDPDQQDERR